MVRMLYGGRNSLMIGVAAALMTTILSVLLGVIAGYFRGWSDTVIRSLLDIMWSFPLRIMFSEIVPNLASTVLVFFTLLIANAVLLEAALSFLGAGVRPPNPSWGTMIDEGVDRIATAPHLTVVPGLMLVLTVLSLNVFGDGVRDALDPRAKVRLEH